MGKKDEEIERLSEALGKQVNINAEQHGENAKLKNQIQEMQDHRQLMVINVNVTGVQDIDKCLGDATSLVTKRLEELKKQDEFVILAVPHTMAIDIPR